VDAPTEVSGLPRFSYAFFEPPTILASLLPDLNKVLPRNVARRRMAKELTHRVPELVDKHCGRLRWDFVQRLDRSRLELERALDERLQLTMEGLRMGVRSALDGRYRSEVATRSARSRIETDRQDLEALELPLARDEDRTGEESDVRR